MSEFLKFRVQVKPWIAIDKKREKILKNQIGKIFISTTPNPRYRDTTVREIVKRLTEFETPSGIADALKNFSKEAATGDVDLLVALFFVVMCCEDYDSTIPHLEKEIFGPRGSFEKEFGWIPKKIKNSSDDSDDDPNSVVLAKLVLSPPRLSSQAFHYSNQPFKVIGRIDEQETLERFAGPERGFRWLQLAGVAGQGKSRLAHELVLLRERDGWEAGILNEKDLTAFASHWIKWDPQKPHLILIDYLVGMEGAIGGAMRALAQRSDELSIPVCVLLLERQRWDRGGLMLQLSAADADDRRNGLKISEGRAEWFARMNESGGRDDTDLAHEKLRFETGVVELTKLDSGDLVGIVRRTAALEEAEIPQGDDVLVEHLGRIDRSGRPLYAYLLAQALIDGVFRPDWDKSSLLTYVLHREQGRRWQYAFPDTDPVSFTDQPAFLTALLATMVRFVDCSTYPWLPSWDRLDDLSVRQALTFTDGPVESLLGPGPIVPGLEPDILGEWFVLIALRRHDLLKQVVEAAWLVAPAQAATFLLRLIQDFPDNNVAHEILKHEPPTDQAKAAYAAIAGPLVAELRRMGQTVPQQGVDALRTAAGAGDAGSMNVLGICHYEGFSVQQSFAEAAIWCRRSANENDPAGMASLGFLYSRGHGVPRDDAVALQWFLAAAELGNLTAMHTAGQRYYSGRGVAAPDIVSALTWWTLAAANGNPASMTALGCLYFNGDEGVVSNTELALDYWEKASDLGDSEAMLNIGKYWLKFPGRDFERLAVYWLTHSAVRENAEAFRELGVYFYQGPVADRNYPSAFSMWRRGADLGSSDAMNDVGDCLWNGTGVQADYAAALDWWHRSANAGNSDAMANLGAAYIEGIRIPRDCHKAAYWWYRSASANNGSALYKLGASFSAKGDCFKHDLPRAIEWMHKSAAAGYGAAMFQLSLWYQQGYGVEQDTERSRYWYERSRAAGYSYEGD